MKPNEQDLRVAMDIVLSASIIVPTSNVKVVLTDAAVSGIASAIAAEREKAAKGEINAALAELRAMFPNEFVTIETETIQKPDGTTSSFVRASAYRQESGETIAEAIAAIRAGDKE